VVSVRVERDLCIGSGNCVRLAPGVFELDGEEIAVVLDPARADRATLEGVANRCPAGAIFLDTEAAGERGGN
jgi:ferredoxin